MFHELKLVPDEMLYSLYLNSNMNRQGGPTNVEQWSFSHIESYYFYQKFLTIKM